MSNQFLKMSVEQLEKNVSDLQRDNEGLKQAVLGVSTSLEALSRKVNMLEKELATKADITHVQLINKQSEIIKKINDSKSIPMDCKVGVSLDGRVVAESIVEHTADSIKCGVIKGSEINGTK
ncbi:hypothetical protein [Bacillus thuringiensis]|uniref:hypothetical protein n=1 Tax=Bacillus thuringiensis TaxID=1428 RepID=UPI0026E37147|nr:hypothetical protein [Bacillus thuringiensis]MDO6634279.1 hypothetical protein [Bacillus thuringiensis]MDO6663510.1 hypothetical protein [Bacillus thuringiensis]MDO6704435.1 hypothetical protein [Bacillus thuringiensis]